MNALLLKDEELVDLALRANCLALNEVLDLATTSVERLTDEAILKLVVWDVVASLNDTGKGAGAQIDAALSSFHIRIPGAKEVVHARVLPDPVGSAFAVYTDVGRSVQWRSAVPPGFEVIDPKKRRLAGVLAAYFQIHEGLGELLETDRHIRHIEIAERAHVCGISARHFIALLNNDSLDLRDDVC